MENRKSQNNDLQFDYFSNNYLEFEETFYRYAVVTTPLTFMTDDLLALMASQQINYFKLPASRSRDYRDHYFFFRITSPAENRRVRVYVYIGHRFSLSSELSC